MVSLTGYRNDEEFTVLTHGLQCTVCSFKTISNRQSEEFTKRQISDAWREKHGRLTGKQIKDARRQLGMSHDQFAQYLKVGPASVHRWENGQIQDEAMNELILLKTDPFAAMANYETVSQGAMVWAVPGAVFETTQFLGLPSLVETQFQGPKKACGVSALPEGEVCIPLC